MSDSKCIYQFAIHLDSHGTFLISLADEMKLEQ